MDERDMKMELVRLARGLADDMWDESEFGTEIEVVQRIRGLAELLFFAAIAMPLEVEAQLRRERQ